MMEVLGAKNVDPKTVMIEATYLKTQHACFKPAGKKGALAP